MQYTVPSKLTNPDKLIVSFQKNLEDRLQYFRNQNEQVIPSNDQLDIKVTRENISRALRFMDTLIKVLKSKGHEITSRYRDTYVVIHNQEVKIQLREKMKRVIIKKDNWNNTELHPTGILSFQLWDIYLRKEWKDGKEKLEHQLERIIIKLEEYALSEQQAEIEREKNRSIKNEKARILREFEQKKEKELNDFKLFLKAAHRWHQTEILRNYLNHVKQNSSPEKESWIEWADKKLAWYDPAMEIEDELLKDVDRDTLTFKK